MSNILQFLGSIFIPHPYLALLPAVFFGLIYLKSKNKILLTTTVSWLLYATYEELNLLRITCSGECNIRIDLLLIYPLLAILSIAALVSGIKHLSKADSL